MTTVYRVVTKHTAQVLKDFVRFSYKVNHPKATFRLCVIGAGFFVLSLFLRHQPAAMIFCIILGVVTYIFAFTRHLIGFSKLAKRDDNYKDQTEIEFVFGHAEFTVKRVDDEQHIKYGEIINAYKDKRNYFLLINDEDLQVIPFSDFSSGEAGEFERFIVGKIGKPVNNLFVSFGKRMKMLNEGRKQAEAMHDEKIEKKKQEKQKRQ